MTRYVGRYSTPQCINFVSLQLNMSQEEWRLSRHYCPTITTTGCLTFCLALKFFNEAVSFRTYML